MGVPTAFALVLSHGRLRGCQVFCVLLLGLALDSHPPGSAGIAGSPYLHLRTGDLRVVYRVQEGERVVIVVRVARRSESTYRRLPR